MFTGFNLILHSEDLEELKAYKEEGENLFKEQKNRIRGTLREYINPDGSLEASKIEEDWFTPIKSHIFISHSHDDEETVKQLAGFLHYKYGIKCFIDSCIWGYANDLLKEIDNKYCIYRRSDGDFCYKYDKRNRSTSHVYMLLNTALAKMINKTECLFFVNTPNSIKAQDIEDVAKTGSPWIYSELLMATEFPHEKLSKYRVGILEENSSFENAELTINYDVRIDKLTKLSFSDLKDIESQCKGKNPLNTLDRLYNNKGLLNNWK